MIVQIGDAFVDLDKACIVLLEAAAVTVYVQGKQHPLTLRATREEIADVRFLQEVRARQALFAANQSLDAMNAAEGMSDAT